MIPEDKKNEVQMDTSMAKLNPTDIACNEAQILNVNTKSSPHKHKHKHKRMSPLTKCIIKHGSRVVFVTFMFSANLMRAFVFTTDFSPAVEFYINLILYSLASLVVINYLFASFTDNRQRYTQYYQGHSPTNYGKKVCKKCPSDFGGNHRVKPARTHHCSVCKTCVAKMDHHCVFIQNCVGLYNHKSYYWLLFWGSFWGPLMVLLISQSCIKFNLYLFHQKKMVWFYISIIISLQIIVMLLGMALSVINLAVFHTKMALFNLTTIEDLDKFRRPYHMGVISNLYAFFGGKYQFLLPVRLNFEDPNLRLSTDNVFPSNSKAPSKAKELLIFKKSKEDLNNKDKKAKRSNEVELKEFNQAKHDKLGLLDQIQDLIKNSKSTIDEKKKIVYMYSGKQIKSQNLL